MFFLDTNTCIYFMNGKYASVRDKILATSPSEIKIPVVVKAELLLGAYKSFQKAKSLKKLEIFLKPFEIVPFTDDMTHTYADIRQKLEKQGTPIGANDLLIASIAKYYKGILITNNTDEFSRVADLKIKNWAIE